MAYVVAGSVVAMVIGFVFSRFGLEKWVEPMVYQTRISQLRAEGHVPTWTERVEATRGEARDIFAKVWKWVILGAAIGAAIHGWVPADFFARMAGEPVKRARRPRRSVSGSGPSTASRCVAAPRW